MADGEYQLTRPKQVRDFHDGINDRFNDTILDDRDYGRPGRVNRNKIAGEMSRARHNGRSKPSRRLSAQGQDYATRDREHMGKRNPDGSMRLIPKNSSPKTTPS